MTKLVRTFVLGVLGISLASATGCLASAADVEGDAEDGSALEATAQSLSATGYGSVAWEELDGATLADLRNQLQHLQGRDIGLTLHWKAENIDDPARWAVVHDAVSRGIKVYPWLTVPESLGYFPNSTNYDLWIANAQYLMFLWRSVHGLPPTAFVVDMEMPKTKLHEFERLTAIGDPFAVAAFLNRNINRIQFAAATTAYRQFVDYAHSLGFTVNLSTLLPLIEDYGDGDDFLRQGFNSPIDGPAWDEVSFQAQRTLYAKSYPVTSFMVYEYGRVVRQRFGARGGLGLGLTHKGISSDESIVYADGTQLRLDVEAAKAAGLPPNRVGVYSFLGMYRRTPVSQWFQVPQIRTPVRDSGTATLRASMQFLDALDWVR
jgi:hypothetical protein